MIRIVGWVLFMIFTGVLFAAHYVAGQLVVAAVAGVWIAAGVLGLTSLMIEDALEDADGDPYDAFTTANRDTDQQADIGETT